MALDPTIIDLIRDEIGDKQDFVDDIVDEVGGARNSLERIYLDTNRGNFSVLRTALLVYRKRRADYEDSGFDVTDAGILAVRSQKMREFNKRIKELEFLVDDTAKADSAAMLSKYQAETGSDTEFS